MRLNDTLVGLMVLLFGAAVALYTRTFPDAGGQSIGPGFFPFLIGSGIAACGAVLMFSGRPGAGGAWIDWESGLREPRLALNGALVIGALVFYALAVDTAGFFLTAFIFIAGLFIAFGVRPRWIVPLAAGVTFGLHFVFYSLLRVPLPWGWLEGIAW